MRHQWTFLPWLVLTIMVSLAIWHGPINQLANYHHFADQRSFWGMPNAADVLSNLSFAVLGAWGSWRLRAHNYGHRLFAMALLLTAIGSAYYHWAPDDARLLWDRLPIALACGGLLAGVMVDCFAKNRVSSLTCGLAMFALFSVLYWRWSGAQGQGDLRPYLLLQLAPLLLIPLWLWLYRAPKLRQLGFAAAVLCYVLAKGAELADLALFEQLGWLSGHTLKHGLAALASWWVIWALLRPAK